MKYVSTCRARFGVLSCAVLAAVCVARAQGPASSQPRELHGQVEGPDGTAFSDGALVKIENDRGGMGAQVLSDSRGKFDVVALQKSWYTVTIHASGFNDASADVDLDTVPRAYVRITLRELSPSAPTATSSTASSAILSVNDLSVPQGAQAEFEKGRSLLLDKHKAADSVKPFLKAIQIAPSYSQAHFLLGTAYMDLGKWVDAEAALNKAISFNDKLGSAYLALGSSLIEQKKFAEAEQPLLHGLELAPNASQGHYDLGRTYYALNRFQEAEVHARKGVDLEPVFPEGHILLGNVLLRLRDGRQALAEFQEYLRLAPQGAFAAATQELVKKLQVGLAQTQ
jgi:Flp pilus assembly protein TadD